MAGRNQLVIVVAAMAICLEQGEAQIPVAGAGHPEFELEFEPLLDDLVVLGSAMDDDMASLPLVGTAAVAAAARKPSLDSHEDKLDRALEAHFGGLLSSLGKAAPQKLRGGKPMAAAIGSMVGPGALPIEAFRSLFPGSLIIEESPMDDLGLGGPDPFVMDMLGETHTGFQEEMLPMVHAAQAAMRSPKACHKDIMKHCGKSRSQLHCLGAHQEDISQECHDTVGKSVPFVCSSAVDKYCDALNAGILPCLEQHMSDLDQNCQDAVVTTRSVITTANTHKVSLSNKQSGAKASVQPTAQAAAEALNKEVLRQAAQVAQSHWRWEHGFIVLTLCAFLYVLLKGPDVYLPESLNSRKGLGGVLVKMQVASEVARAAVTALIGSSRGREAEHLLSGLELPKPVDSVKL